MFAGTAFASIVVMTQKSPRSKTSKQPSEEERQRPPVGGEGVGTIGYTSSYRKQPPEIAEVSVVSVLEARGPE